jgi:hypothetical protein
MRLPRCRVRTLLIAVGLVAVLIWGAVMLPRSYTYYRLARHYARTGRYYRARAVEGRVLLVRPWNPEMMYVAEASIEDRARLERLGWFEVPALEVAEKYAGQARKYRRAMYLPFLPVAPDPPLRVFWGLGRESHWEYAEPARPDLMVEILSAEPQGGITTILRSSTPLTSEAQ